MTLVGLENLLDRARSRRIACFGDVMLDRFVYGGVERISPEAPVPVMSRLRETAMLGGAANVARNIAALGCRAGLTGLAGDDEAGTLLLALAEAEGGIDADLVVDPSRPTTQKTRFVAGGQQLLRLDVEDAQAPDAAVQSALSRKLAELAASADAVLISDYAKGAVTARLLDVCRQLARARGAPLIVDPKGPSFAVYGEVDLIKPNAKELALVTGRPVGTDQEVEAALAAALEACSARAILVTRAAAGMSLLVRGGEPRHFRGPPRQVFDVSGAGDTALAALGAALGAGVDLEAAAAFALLAAGVVVGKAATAVATPRELMEALAMEAAAAEAGKLASLDRLTAEVGRWRAQGLRIGFTNGCFDILHRGHVAYLSKAKEACDRLIVAVNSDASVRALKGEGRPVNDLESRSLVLAGLSSVDLVVSFDAPTPIDLIAAVRPDVLLKGADYTVETVVGADLVLAGGGQVVLVPLVEGVSTTAAIRKMKAQT
jgi:D-beta-D-heptose 7-phosphate kinase/D-beta-D-heptose 1-phosphate adenosyltransferase